MNYRQTSARIGPLRIVSRILSRFSADRCWFSFPINIQCFYAKNEGPEDNILHREQNVRRSLFSFYYFWNFHFFTDIWPLDLALAHDVYLRYGRFPNQQLFPLHFTYMCKLLGKVLASTPRVSKPRPWPIHDISPLCNSTTTEMPTRYPLSLKSPLFLA